jgi:translation initiation factor 3 subunit B
MSSTENERSIEDALAEEAAELDGYFSDAPLEPEPNYPPLKDTFESTIIITNLPKVPMAKLDKLTKVVMKLVSRIGNLASCEETGFTGVFMPFDEANDKSLGFLFCEYETPEEAKNAIGALHEYNFDKNHSLSVSPYSSAEKLKDLKETEFVEPKPAPFVEKPNAMSWLEDPSQRDQFVIRQGKETEVFWFDAKNDPLVDYDGAREKEAGVSWCEYYCHWSPKGSYLATLVPARGVILWSGENWQKSGRFVAPDVKQVVFSPQENYLITSNLRKDDDTAVKIFHLATGKLLRAFPLYPDNFPQGDDVPPPPFLWSHDDQYVARMGKDLISIFSTPSMRLLEKKSLLAEGIHEFQWSPKANILTYWVSSLRQTQSRTFFNDYGLVLTLLLVSLFSLSGSRTPQRSSAR